MIGWPDLTNGSRSRAWRLNRSTDRIDRLEIDEVSCPDYKELG